MNTYILIYNSFVQFEVVLAAYFMKTQGEVYTLGLGSSPVNSSESFSVNPAKTLSEVNVQEIDLLIIPGGETEEIIKDESLLKLLRELDTAGKVIGGICGGVSVLKAAGILNNRKFVEVAAAEEGVSAATSGVNVMVDGNIVTALPNGYVDFALELGTLMNIYKDKADYQETIDFFKYFKTV
ncbi:DJ-1/PfpI family protein [Paenibacillus sp. GCM10012306]|uniref:DJ-1/PfpI family protein n=1 Tax=Paenibacillus sp. GCM10012306 TaxID=3317342 RepID=UPI0036147644